MALTSEATRCTRDLQVAVSAPVVARKARDFHSDPLVPTAAHIYSIVHTHRKLQFARILGPPKAARSLERNTRKASGVMRAAKVPRLEERHTSGGS